MIIQVENKFGSDNIIAFAQQELVKYLQMSNIDVNEYATIHVTFIKEEFSFDGYRLNGNLKNIQISSKLSRGILYGVYEYLRLLGFNFMFPGDENCAYPKTLDFNQTITPIEKVPYMEYRGLCLYGVVKKNVDWCIKVIDWMAKNNYNLLLTSIMRLDDSKDDTHAILWHEVGDELLSELKKRGILIDMSEHATDYFFPRKQYFQSNPEWFALIDGERQPTQICYSNQTAVDVYAKAYCHFVKEHDEMGIIGVWPLDGNGYCECESCKDKYTVYNATKYVAEKIKEIRDDLIVEFPAYKPESLTPPVEKMPDNLSVLVCNVKNETAYKWSEQSSKGGAFYFEYFTADNYQFATNVWLNPVHCKEVMNTMINYQYRGIISLYLPITTWWQASINYFIMRLGYYNPVFDIDDIIDELIKSLFNYSNVDEFKKIFKLLFDKLQDRTLWSTRPFSNEYLVEHRFNRNTALDLLQKKRFEEVYEELQLNLNRIDIEQMDEYGKKQFSYFKQYIHNQKLFFHLIDKFNADIVDKEQLKPYFENLRYLNAHYPALGISENYAGWRLL